MSGSKLSPASVSSPPRDIAFVRQRDGGAPWHADGADATAVYDALSLLFPDGERFFIESVKIFRSKAEGKLAADIRDFIGQEALHTREHAAFNALIDAPSAFHARVDALIQAQIAKARTQGPVAMLGATIALEHMTAIFADIVLRDPAVMASPREDVSRLWQWHAMEEAEHKGVAFDLFATVSRKWSGWNRYRARAISMVLATHMFLWNWSTVALWLLERQGVTGFSARWRLYRVWFGPRGLLRRSLGGYFAWFRPGFHPWDHDNRALIAQWRSRFVPSGDVHTGAEAA
jgi:hypothetical protein